MGTYGIAASAAIVLVVAYVVFFRRYRNSLGGVIEWWDVAHLLLGMQISSSIQESVNRELRRLDEEEKERRKVEKPPSYRRTYTIGKVRVGENGMSYILDEDGYPISEGFHEIEPFAWGYVLGKLGSCSYVLDKNGVCLTDGHHTVSPCVMGTCYVEYGAFNGVVCTPRTRTWAIGILVVFGGWYFFW